MAPVTHGMNYRPDIDGVRAIAVLSVLIYHLQNSALPGGFVGVDVFFVISGFLITRNLVADIDRPGGLSVVDFYNRRIRRIAPALITMLIGTLIAGYFILVPGDFGLLGESAIFAAFGLSNFFFYKNTGYFDPQADLQPLLHTWSLGVEEQFYLVWPLLLAGFAWLAKGRRSLVPALISLVIAASFIFWAYKLATKPNYAFYQPHTRAWELAAGALLVFVAPVRSKVLSEVFAGVGLVLVVCSFMLSAWPVAGANVVPAVIGSALLLLPKENSVVGRLLSLAPMRGTGLISYSLYLWHWPLIVFFRHYANGAALKPIEAVAISVASFACAFLSWKYVEKPMRRRWGSPAKVIIAGLASAAVLASVGFLIDQTGGFRSRLQGDVANMGSRDQMWEWECPAKVFVKELDGEFCTFGAPWESAPIKGVLWGDSHAQHMAPMIEAAAEGGAVSFLLYEACPAIIGEGIRRNIPANPQYTANCARLRAKALDWLRSHPEIRLVVLASAWAPLPALVTQNGSTSKELSGRDLVSSGLRDVLAQMAGPGRRVILVGQVPSIGLDPAPCIVGEAIGLLRRSCGDLGKRSASYYRRTQAGMNDLIGKIAAERLDTVAILPGDALCDDGRCIVSLNGEFLYRDFDHLRRNLSMGTRKAYASLIGLPDALR